MNIAAVVAGGTGTRLGGNLPKQFLDLEKMPVLCYSLSVFLAHPQIDYVIVGTHKDYISLVEEYRKKFFNNTQRLIIKNGGPDRNGTLLNILSAARELCHAPENSVIISHDAARPFVTPAMIDDALHEIRNYDIVCTAVPAVDTTVIAPNGQVCSFPDRSELLRLQTPQTFRLNVFKSVYAALSPEQRRTATDVSGLFYLCGRSIKFTKGSESNIKITYPQDLTIAKALLMAGLCPAPHKGFALDPPKGAASRRGQSALSLTSFALI